tara:strand:- start:11702 stop:12181 length:480 start_codon:yes stop_codon:yes gene_type:complete
MTTIPRKWSKPKIAKMYEAFSAVADGRITMLDDQTASVASSDRSKSYTVNWDVIGGAYGSNDNASHFVGYIGYPVIAVLIEQGKISVDRELVNCLKGVNWNALNKRHKRDYDAAIEEVLEEVARGNVDPEEVRSEAKRAFDELLVLDIGRISSTSRPVR